MSSKVIVLGTMHDSEGVCNASSLLQIVHEISPKTIYFEASEAKYPQMLKAVDHFNTPEIQVLRKIEKESTIEVKPVDLDNDPFDGRLEAMLELFPKHVPDYKYASLIQRNEAIRLGFRFLNSSDNDKINSDKAAMESIFIDKVQDDFLMKTYSDWLEWNDQRENYWISKIHEHCSNKIGTTLLLVGSAHRIRLKEKIVKMKSQDQSIADWEFNYFG